MKIRSGHIPTDIVYIFGATSKVANRWDDADQPDEELVYTEVTPAFVADADNEKSIKTGAAWAQNRCVVWDANTRASKTIAVVQKVQRENQPLENLRVIGLEIRGEGGRAYKALTPDGFYFDLREDVLLETMLSKGIQPGGVLAGRYIWARVGSEMKLVRLDSQLFTALLESGERAVLSSISKNKLEVGTIYETKLGDRGIFLGYTTTESWKLDWPNKLSSHKNQYMNNNDKPKLLVKKLNRHMLWFDVSHWYFKNTRVDPTPSLFQTALVQNDLSHYFSLRTSHAMVRAIGKVEVPEDVVEKVRLKAVVSYHDRISRQLLASKTTHTNPYGGRPKRTYAVEEVVAHAASFILMYKPGTSTPDVDEPTFQALRLLAGKEIP